MTSLIHTAVYAQFCGLLDKLDKVGSGLDQVGDCVLFQYVSLSLSLSLSGCAGD